MRFAPIAVGAAALITVTSQLSPRAGAATNPRTEQVVATIGPTSITVGDVERRLAAIPSFQRVTFGTTAGEIRRNFLERILIPEALLSMGAAERRLDEAPPARDRLQEILRTARLSAVRNEVIAAGVTHDELARHYQENLSRFQAPERLSLWRILCATEAEANEVLDSAKKDSRPQHWNELARSHSIDKSTAMRGGNIGLVSAEGTPGESGVRIDPLLYAAASKVKDGDLVERPVAEGQGFAVIWRRGSVSAVHRTLEDEEGAIKQVVLREKFELAVKELVKKLREAVQLEEHPQLVDTIEVDTQGTIAPKKRPGVLQHKAMGHPEPGSTPRGLR